MKMGKQPMHPTGSITSSFRIEQRQVEYEEEQEDGEQAQQEQPSLQSQTYLEEMTENTEETGTLICIAFDSSLTWFSKD